MLPYRWTVWQRRGVLFTQTFMQQFPHRPWTGGYSGGYPAQPTTSIMKYPRKIQNLPAIAGSLRDARYRTKYYYGGDADFTNMRSYLMSSGFENIISDQGLSRIRRLVNRAHDHLVFQHVAGRYES